MSNLCQLNLTKLSQCPKSWRALYWRTKYYIKDKKELKELFALSEFMKFNQLIIDGCEALYLESKVHFEEGKGFASPDFTIKLKNNGYWNVEVVSVGSVLQKGFEVWWRGIIQAIDDKEEKFKSKVGHEISLQYSERYEVNPSKDKLMELRFWCTCASFIELYPDDIRTSLCIELKKFLKKKNIDLEGDAVSDGKTEFEIIIDNIKKKFNIEAFSGIYYVSDSIPPDNLYDVVTASQPITDKTTITNPPSDLIITCRWIYSEIRKKFDKNYVWKLQNSERIQNSLLLVLENGSACLGGGNRSKDCFERYLNESIVRALNNGNLNSRFPEAIQFTCIDIIIPGYKLTKIIKNDSIWVIAPDKQ